MLRLLQWLFVGCAHRWKTLAAGNVVDAKGFAEGRWYDQECTECGKRRYYQN